MSLVGTLGKIAMGVVAAKAASSMMRGGGSGGGLGGMLGGALGGGQGQQQGGGGLGGMLGGALGGGQGQQQGGGGLGGLLGGALGGGAGAGGLAGGLGSLLGGGAQQEGQQGGGLGGLLGGQSQQGGAGGLGGLLDSLGGGAGQAGAGGFIRAMLNSAKCDGNFDASEQEKILKQMGDISQEDADFINTEINSPLDVQGFISSVPGPMQQQVYLMSILAIDLDSQEEAQYLDQLVKGFGMSEQQSNDIHAKLGVPALYG